MVTTLKATHFVRPAADTMPMPMPPNDEIIYLNSCDQIKDITHTPTIYFYKHSAILDDHQHVISILKISLSRALSLFYPLSGRLQWASEGGSRVELHCNGAGVPIFEAESDAAVEDFGDFSPTPAIQSLIPSVDYTTPIDEIPLVIVQLTKLSCGGVSIGLGISHVMADGPSALHFVDEWTKFARGGAAGPAVAPFLDRRALDNERPPECKFDPSVLRPPPTLIGQEDSLEQRKKPISAAFHRLSKSQIKKLRDRANLDFSGVGGKRGYSRFEAIAAHIWRCTSKARGHVPEQQTSLHFVADFRNKIVPPLPKNYFGNALIRVEATDESGSLLSGSIGTTCKKIREAVDKVTGDTVRAYLDFLKGLPDVGRFRSLDNNGRPKGDFYGNPNLAIISWMGLPLYGVDFGWGSEVHVGPGPMGFDGKTFLIPGREGDGSLKVAIWLQEECMGAFKNCFYEDI